MSVFVGGTICERIMTMMDTNSSQTEELITTEHLYIPVLNYCHFIL